MHVLQSLVHQSVALGVISRKLPKPDGCSLGCPTITSLSIVVSPMSSLDTTKWVRLCSDLGRHFLPDFLRIFRVRGCRIKASGITRESKG